MDKLVSCSSLSRWTSAAAAAWVRGHRVSSHLGVWIPRCQQMETGKRWADEWHFPPVVRILGGWQVTHRSPGYSLKLLLLLYNCPFLFSPVVLSSALGTLYMLTDPAASSQGPRPQRWQCRLISHSGSRQKGL